MRLQFPSQVYARYVKKTSLELAVVDVSPLTLVTLSELYIKRDSPLE